MDISNIAGNRGWAAGAAQGDTAGNVGAAHDDSSRNAGLSRSAVSVTVSRAEPEDVAAAAITATDLSRDDALGKLVSAAFNLPPPPLPFPA